MLILIVACFFALRLKEFLFKAVNKQLFGDLCVLLTAPAAGRIWTERLSQTPPLCPSPAERCLWPPAGSCQHTHTDEQVQHLYSYNRAKQARPALCYDARPPLISPPFIRAGEMLLPSGVQRYLFSLSYISLEVLCRCSISWPVFSRMLSSSSLNLASYSDLYWSLVVEAGF